MKKGKRLKEAERRNELRREREKEEKEKNRREGIRVGGGWGQEDP